MENIASSLLGARSLLLEMYRLAIAEVEYAASVIRDGHKEDTPERMKDDLNLDKLYEETERVCFKILLLEAPFATDFRKLSAILKMITDLERIGDYSVDILEECMEEPLPLGASFPKLITLSEYVIEIMKRSFYAFLNEDYIKARELAKEDDKIDSLFLEIRKELAESGVSGGSASIQAALISKFLERMGDHVVNLGEWIDYGLTGTHLLS